MTEVSDEWHEGYAAFNDIHAINPYIFTPSMQAWLDWEAGYIAAYLDWRELMGA